MKFVRYCKYVPYLDFLGTGAKGSKDYLTDSLAVLVGNVSQLPVSMFQMQEGIGRNVAQLTAETWV